MVVNQWWWVGMLTVVYGVFQIFPPQGAPYSKAALGDLSRSDRPLSGDSGPVCDLVEIDPLAAAIALAEQAQHLENVPPTTGNQWHTVANTWLGALNYVEKIPPTHPQKPYGQKLAMTYLQGFERSRQRLAQTQTPPFPSFHSAFLDQQLWLYQSYIAAVGVPDVLIVGSSRAGQGVDPQVLAQELTQAQEGDRPVRVYNFGVNGATAQVVQLVLMEVLTPDQLPPRIIWADGARAFNSGRRDRTYEAIVQSPGYQALGADEIPPMPPLAEAVPFTQCQPLQSRFWPGFFQSPAMATSSLAINANGFLSLERVFVPTEYFQTFPQVPGQYDGDYGNFSLSGVQFQAFEAVTDFLAANNIDLWVVNLPLSDVYLDPVRLAHERQFSELLTRAAQDKPWHFVDLGRRWPTQYQLFFDPSHLNNQGAIAVAQLLASQIPAPAQGN